MAPAERQQRVDTPHHPRTPLPRAGRHGAAGVAPRRRSRLVCSSQPARGSAGCGGRYSCGPATSRGLQTAGGGCNGPTIWALRACRGRRRCERCDRPPPAAVVCGHHLPGGGVRGASRQAGSVPEKRLKWMPGIAAGLAWCLDKHGSDSRPSLPATPLPTAGPLLPPSAGGPCQAGVPVFSHPPAGFCGAQHTALCRG